MTQPRFPVEFYFTIPMMPFEPKGDITLPHSDLYLKYATNQLKKNKQNKYISIQGTLKKVNFPLPDLIIQTLMALETFKLITYINFI